MKKKTSNSRIIKADKNSTQWYLHQRIGRFADRLNDLPTAAEVRKIKRRTAPLHMADMVF